MTSASMDNALSGGHCYPNSSQLITYEYYDGTKQVAPLLKTSAFPIALLDLPTEIIYDTCLLPFQYMNKLHKERKEQKAQE